MTLMDLKEPLAMPIRSRQGNTRHKAILRGNPHATRSAKPLTISSAGAAFFAFREGFRDLIDTGEVRCWADELSHRSIRGMVDLLDDCFRRLGSLASVWTRSLGSLPAC